MGLRFGVKAEILVGVADGLAERSFDERLLVEFAANSRCGSVERSANLEVGIGLGVGVGLHVRAGLSQQIALQKSIDGLGGGGFSVCAIPLVDGAIAIFKGLAAGCFRKGFLVRGGALGSHGAIAVLIGGMLSSGSTVARCQSGALCVARATGFPSCGGDPPYQHGGDARKSSPNRAIAARGDHG